jgi:hypothetical protein
VAEEEWNKQGIGFKSRAEQAQNRSADTGQVPPTATAKSGSELLENLQRQILIFDQYDIAMSKQDSAMLERQQRRLQALQDQRQQQESDSMDYDIVYDGDNNNKNDKT